jgi:hypothetical protein
MRERLIDWVPCLIDDHLAIEEFIADERGGFWFFDCFMDGKNEGQRRGTAWYGSALKARGEWKRKTGRELSQMDVFRLDLVLSGRTEKEDK